MVQWVSEPVCVRYLISGGLTAPQQGSIMVNLIYQVIFIGLFCGGIIGAMVGEPYLMGSCLLGALGVMMMIMSREDV